MQSYSFRAPLLLRRPSALAGVCDFPAVAGITGATAVATPAVCRVLLPLAKDAAGREAAMAAAPAAVAAGEPGPASKRAGLCHGPAAFRTAGER